MIEVNVSIEIAVPAEEAFGYLADVTNNPQWQIGVERTVWVSSTPGDVGATFDQTIAYKNMVTSYQLTAIEPGKSMTVKTTHGATIPTEVTRTVQALSDNSCRIDVHLTGELRGWRKLMKRGVAKAVRQSIESDYRQLQRRLEGAGPAGESEEANPADTP